MFRFFVAIIVAYAFIPNYGIFGGAFALTLSALSGYFLRHFIALKLGSNGRLSFVFLLSLLISVSFATYVSSILVVSFFTKLFSFIITVLIVLILDAIFNEAYTRQILLAFLFKKTGDIYKPSR